MGVDGHDLDLVHATTDGLFKAMNGRLHSLWTDASLAAGNEGELSRSCYSQTSEGAYETACTLRAAIDRTLKKG